MRADEIPKSFKLLDHTVKVVKDSDTCGEYQAFGLWMHSDLTIYIDPNVPPSMIAHTFYHELMHAVLDLTGHSELSANERFVDSMGGALAQVMRTMK